MKGFKSHQRIKPESCKIITLVGEMLKYLLIFASFHIRLKQF